MEKLQAAIEIARRQRAAQEGRAPQAAGPGPDATDLPADAASPDRSSDDRGLDQPTVTTDAAWNALREVQLNRGALIHSRILSLNASAESAPFDVLRTKILYQMRQNNWRRLAVTSPMPQCGKTTTSVNLALALSRQPELRTILFDFDLRAPTVTEKLGLKDAPSITPLLSGKTRFQDHAVRVGPNLALALSGAPDSDPTRLLMADSTREVLARIQADYAPDIMIFDLPSILIGDDARAFLQHVDCALILARAEQTRYGDFDSCEREVGEYTNVLGVVLNGYRHADGKFDAVEGTG